MFASTVLAVAVAAAVQAAPGAELAGRWEGALPTGGGQSLRVVLRVDASGAAVIDSPDQNVVGLPVEGMTQVEGMVRFAIPAVQGRFEGRLSDDGTVLTGVMKQGGADVPLALTRTAAAASVGAPPRPPARPQTPTGPFPYRAETVQIDNPAAPGVRLAGTLTLPEGEGPFPLAVLITGSGPQDRDETVFGHKPFLVLADALTRRGVAVYRYDDRGIGASSGVFGAATTRDFASDALAVARALAARPEIDPARVGLIGHSEGGIVAPLAVEAGAPAAWLVTLAGPTVPGGDLVTEQVRLIAAASGQPPAAVDQAAALQASLMAAVARHPDDGPAAAREVSDLLVAAGQPRAQADAAARSVSTDWYRGYVIHDPAPSLAAVRVPMLAVYGGLDLQVPGGANGDRLKSVNPAAEIVILPGLNHMMQPAATGLMDEYARIETTFDPAALALVVDWVAARSGR